jgi:hypothetical protein
VSTTVRSTAHRPGTTAAAAAYVLSWIGGLVLAPAAPGHDAPAAEVADFYAAHGGAVLSSALLVHGTAGLALAALAVGIARATGVRAKIALLAAFAAVATTVADRAGAAPRWLQVTAAALVPLLLVGSAALAGIDALLPVLEVSLLVLLAWAAAIGRLVSRHAARDRRHPSPAT